MIRSQKSAARSVLVSPTSPPVFCRACLTLALCPFGSQNCALVDVAAGFEPIQPSPDAPSGTFIRIALSTMTSAGRINRTADSQDRVAVVSTGQPADGTASTKSARSKSSRRQVEGRAASQDENRESTGLVASSTPPSLRGVQNLDPTDALSLYILLVDRNRNPRRVGLDRVSWHVVGVRLFLVSFSGPFVSFRVTLIPSSRLLRPATLSLSLICAPSLFPAGYSFRSLLLPLSLCAIPAYPGRTPAL